MDYLLSLAKLVVDHAPELSGVVLPVVVDYFNKDVHNDNERQIVSVIVCIVWAVLLKWNSIMTGDATQFYITLGLIYTESNNIFKLYFKNSLVRYQIMSLYTDVPQQGTVGTPNSTPQLPVTP